MADEEKPIEQMTVEEAKGEIDKRLSDFTRPYWDKNHPLYNQEVEEVRKLHEVAYPQKGAEPHDGLADKLEKEGATLEDIEKAGEKNGE
ncbi:MAG: hypothetical protein GTN76_09430 [Candidatus Aenigmarchaeota archaeon]|nr:hypothetical protein [Candidatus Aenigmarchaeota archaeon]